MTSIPYTMARLVWLPAATCGRNDRFAVVRQPTPDDSSEHNAAAAWGVGRVYWLGPGSNDTTFKGLHDLDYVTKLQELFVELTTDFGLDPVVVRREFEKIDLWSKHWRKLA